MTDPERRFTDLIERHEGLIAKVCRAYARGAAFDDLRQEVLVQLWRAWPRYRGDAKESTWLYRVALNTAISHLRRRTARPETAPLPPALPDAAAGPADAYARREAVRRLYDAVARLDALDRALVLLYLDDVPYREMADVTGLTVNHIGVRLHRARRKLAALLEEVPA